MYKLILAIFSIVGIFLSNSNQVLIENKQFSNEVIADEQVSNPLNIELFEQYFGVMSKFSIQGNYAYMGIGSKLHVIDISSPGSPMVVGESEILPDRIIEVVVSGNLSFILTNKLGIYVFSVENPTLPTKISFLELNDINNTSLLIDGNYAYINSFWGMRVIDISNPQSLTPIGFLSGNFISSTKSGNLVFSIGYSPNQLSVIDVSNPQSPTIVGNVATLSHPTGISISGNFVFISEWEHLEVINIENPSLPFMVTSYPIFKGYSVSVSGSSIFVGEENGIRILDFINSSALNPIGYVDGAKVIHNSILLSNYLYSANGGGMFIIDVTNLSEPQIVNQYESWSPVGIKSDNSYLYLSSSGIRVINKSNPSNLIVEGIFDNSIGGTQFSLTDNYAFFLMSSRIISIVDITNPGNLYEVDHFYSKDLVSTMEIDKKCLYLGEFLYGDNIDDFNVLRILDISNPIQPKEIGNIETSYKVIDIEVSDHYAYVLEQDLYNDYGNEGLSIINIENPYSPIKVGFYPFNSSDYEPALSVKDYYLYLVSANGLDIIDVSDPTNPYSVGNVNITNIDFNDIFIKDRFAFITGKPLLSVYDIGDPTNPLEVGRFDMFDIDSTIIGFGLFVEDEFIYITVPYIGLLILKWDTGETYSLSGQILDDLGNPISGVRINSDSGYTGQSDSNGFYTLSGLEAGQHKIRPNKSSYLFLPDSIDVSIYGNVNSVNFIGNLVDCAGLVNFGIGTSTVSDFAFQSGICPMPFFGMPFLYLPFKPVYFNTFTKNWNNDSGQIQSWFDHDTPNSRDGYKIATYDGREHKGITQSNCFNNICYDGHNGYDFSQGTSDGWIYPASEGEIYPVYKGCKVEKYFDFADFTFKRTIESLNCGGGWGNHVWIDHGNNYRTLYAHLDSVEDNIFQGKLIYDRNIRLGKIGETGRSTGVHLHFGLYYNWQGKDPWGVPTPNEAVDPFGWSPVPWRSDPSGIPSIDAWVEHNPVTKIIGLNGGYVFSPSGLISVHFPNGVIDQPFVFTIGESPSYSISGSNIISVGKSFWTSLINYFNSSSSTEPNNTYNLASTNPISIQVNFNSDDVAHINLNKLSIYKWEDAVDEWVPLPTELDQVNHIARTQTTDTGIFDLKGPLICIEDQTEPDDNFRTASPVESEGMQVNRLFDNQSDEDWIKFNTVYGKNYQIQVSPHIESVNPKIELYGTDGTTIIGGSVENPLNGEETIYWDAPATDFYYLRIIQESGSLFGCHAKYSLTISPNLQIHLPLVTK